MDSVFIISSTSAGYEHSDTVLQGACLTMQDAIISLDRVKKCIEFGYLKKLFKRYSERKYNDNDENLYINVVSPEYRIIVMEQYNQFVKSMTHNDDMYSWDLGHGDWMDLFIEEVEFFNS